MKVSYCFGCMENTPDYPCPRCGYMPSVSSSAYSLRPGTILKGKYLLGKVLGQGGFGITYIGMDLALQRKVAIKEFYPANCVGRETGTNRVLWYDTPQAQETMSSGQAQFLKEARKMSRVSNISTVVHVFDVFQENGTAYICMEFIEGRTLQQMLQQTGPLPWAKTREIFLPIIQIMEQVHQQGLVHRDLSPDNLMIQPDGTVKILDLGAAKDLNLNTGASSMQVAKGGFSPIEQYITSGESGSWTDVYAMAATMYYTLTGVIPPTSMDRLNQDTLRWDLPQLQVLPAGVRKALVHAMAVRMGDRTRTMAAFFQELQHKMPDKPISGEKPAFSEKARSIAASVRKTQNNAGKKPGILSPAILSAAALVLILVIILGIISSSTKDAEDPLPALSTTEAVPEVTEAVSETTLPAPETTEAAEPMPEVTAEEAKALIADIEGKSGKNMLSTYSEAIKYEKFWKSEGKAEKRVIDNYEVQYIPLYDTHGSLCGQKERHEYITGSLFTPAGSILMWIEDAADKQLYYKKTLPDGTVDYESRNLYDADGIKIRTIAIGVHSSTDSTTYIDDYRYVVNGEEKYCHINIDFDTDNSYTITVSCKAGESDYVTILKKSYNAQGKQISAS